MIIVHEFWSSVIGITPRCGTSARVIQEAGGITCDVENEDDIAAALVQIFDGPVGPRSISMNRATLRTYEYREVTGTLIDFMRRILQASVSC